MVNKKEDVATSATAAEVQEEVQNVKKINRRGVAAARGTTRLKFSHEPASF